MDDVLNRCVLVTDHHSYHTSFSQLKDVIESKGCCLDKLIPLTGCNSNKTLAILKDHKDVDYLRLTSKSSYRYPNLHFEKFHIVEDVQTDVCTIELSETIAELAKILNSQEFYTLQKTSTSIGDVLLVFGDLSDNIFLASVLTEKVGEYLKAVYNAGYVNVENPSETKTIDDFISQSFVVTGFPAGSSKDKIQIALQRTKDGGGGEVECIYPVGSLKKSAIAIFSDSHVADKLKTKVKMKSDMFPGHTLQMKALTDYGDLGSQYIQVKGFRKYESIEKTKEKLIINLQSQSAGGDDVIYPVGQAEDIALVEFHDNSVSGNLLWKKTITAKDGAVIHFKKAMSLVKCVKGGVIGQLNESALQICPEIKDALNEKEGIKWATIGKNKYLFYTQDYLQELRCFAAEHIMESCEGTPDTCSQNDVKYPPKHEEKIHSAERLPPSMRTVGAGISGWKSGDVKMSEKSRTSKHCPILIEDVEYNLLSGTKLVIHHGDITNEDVDVIVNAANSNLCHGGGVAFAIAQKAGPELEREGDDIIRRRGFGLSVGDVTVTKGYNLKAKHVIHAVGPNKWDNERSFRSDLLDTFRNCLECANTNLNAKAIALPLISTGIFGGDIQVQVCAEELSNALIAFRDDSALYKQPGLREIRIVDNNIEVILTIQDTFKVFAESLKTRNVESDSTEEDMECIQSKEKGGRATGGYHMRAPSQKRKSPSAEDIKCSLCKRLAPNLVNLDCNHPICASCLSTLLKNRGKTNKCPVCKKSISDLELELRCFAAEHIMESCEGTPDTCRQNDVKYLPKHEEKIHSAERLPPSMRTVGAGISGWKSGDVKMSEKSRTSKHCPILIEDVEYDLLSGTKLVIHHGDITNEDVDVIVIAANGNLCHGGGVALAIAQKAGPELKREGDDIIRRRGFGLSVGDVTVTKGYNLKAKHVIHAVGPNKWDNKRSFRSDLLDTFRNCLECANTNLNAKAIALPLISAGLEGDIQVCAEELSNALIAFRDDSALYKQPGLREIRIVDNNIEVILTIQDTFKVFAESLKTRNVETTEEDMEWIQSEEKGGRATGEYHMRAVSQKRKSTSTEDIKYFPPIFPSMRMKRVRFSDPCRQNNIYLPTKLAKTNVLVGNNLPTIWSPMSENENVKVVDLCQGQEYQSIKQKFTPSSTRQFSIVKISRIQNIELWKQYAAKKEAFEKSMPGQKVERVLYHGTDESTIDKVTRGGFNRSYAGRNATAFGSGTYFAVGALYSAGDKYSKPNANREKHIFLCHVLVGKYTRGAQSMLEPPQQPKSNDLYHSVVDNVANPSIFVIFNDVQAYPSYIVTFK